jgi:acyl-CoA thioesterase
MSERINIRELISRDKFAAYLGIELLEADDGKAKAKMEIQDHHTNAVQMAHGGAIFSLADLTLAAASNSYGKLAVSINAHITYIKAVQKGFLFAEAIEISKNDKLATYEIKVTNEANELIASFQGMVYLRK